MATYKTYKNVYAHPHDIDDYKAIPAEERFNGRKEYDTFHDIVQTYKAARAARVPA